LFATKADVFVDGGPAHPGAAGLPDGTYYIQLTAPDGTLLGSSVFGPDIAHQKPIAVVNGSFVTCYELQGVVYKASDHSALGYDTTTNPGGEYKVWVSSASDFSGGSTKTDNFKIQSDINVGTQIVACKFFDSNADSIWDSIDRALPNWPMTLGTLDPDGLGGFIFNPIGSPQLTDANGCTIFANLEVGTYAVQEGTPTQTNWYQSAPKDSNGDVVNPAGGLVVAAGQTTEVDFGNYCLVPSGGLTLGFWSNKNGQALITAADLTFLDGLNLRNANGSNFDPTSKTQLRSWLLNATATNMAYMLSAQLAAMELNVRHGFVDGAAFYIPYGGTINDLIFEANQALTTGLTLAGSPARSYQETLKNYLDQLNNGAPVIPTTPCAYSF
jgi:hypothetical protein